MRIIFSYKKGLIEEYEKLPLGYKLSHTFSQWLREMGLIVNKDMEE